MSGSLTPAVAVCRPNVTARLWLDPQAGGHMVQRNSETVPHPLVSHPTPLSVPWALALQRRRIPIPEIRDSLSGVRPVAAQVLLVQLLDTLLNNSTLDGKC